jgi:membrane-anchored glycerophosphoryl diester phosphodiesterase (GDPDase)
MFIFPCRFVDGASYFEAVAEALEKAKEEIFITDWWYGLLSCTCVNILSAQEYRIFTVEIFNNKISELKLNILLCQSSYVVLWNGSLA